MIGGQRPLVQCLHALQTTTQLTTLPAALVLMAWAISSRSANLRFQRLPIHGAPLAGLAERAARTTRSRARCSRSWRASAVATCREYWGPATAADSVVISQTGAAPWARPAGPVAAVPSTVTITATPTPLYGFF